MSRNYFSQPSTILPPRGGRVELLEIRPLRPNQDVILPGMGIKGQRVRFEYRERGHYRSRSGFSQTDGISQFAGSMYHRHEASQIFDRPPFSSSSHLNLTNSQKLLSQLYAFPSIKNTRNPGNISSVSSAPPLSRTVAFSATSRFGGGRLVSGNSVVPSSYHRANKRHTSCDVKRRLEEVRIMAGLKQTLNGYTNHVMHLPPKSYAFGRTMKEKKPEEDRKPKVLYQNYVYVSEDDEDDSLRKSSAKRLSASRDTLYPEMTRKTPSPRAQLEGAYDMLFERHVRKLSNLGSDGEDRYHNGSSSPKDDDDDDDVSSLDDSEKIELMGQEIVQRSIEEVTDGISKRLRTSSSSPDLTTMTSERRVTFAKSPAYAAPPPEEPETNGKEEEEEEQQQENGPETEDQKSKLET